MAQKKKKSQGIQQRTTAGKKASKKATKKVATSIKATSKKKATKKSGSASGSKKTTKKMAAAPTTKKEAPKRTLKKAFADAVAAVKDVVTTVTDSITPSSKIVGAPAPSISLDSTGNKTVDLSKLNGKKVVLYFYPKDDTPGCTLEGQDFTRLHKQFKDAGAEVYGVSRDTVNSHDKFRSKYKYSIDLLSDSKEELCNAYDVIKMKNMYGKQVRGIERSTFVIGPDGKVVKEWRKVSVPGHAEEVLKFVKSL